MTSKPQYVRRMSGIRERICDHGVGHPTIESAKAVAAKNNHDLANWMTHGCDGCCLKWDE